MRRNQNIYLPTRKGLDLLPILVEMMVWGLRYDEHTPASEEFVRRIANERPKIVEEVTYVTEQGTFETYRLTEMGIDPSLYQARGKVPITTGKR